MNTQDVQLHSTITMPKLAWKLLQTRQGYDASCIHACLPATFAALQCVYLEMLQSWMGWPDTESLRRISSVVYPASP